MPSSGRKRSSLETLAQDAIARGHAAKSLKDLEEAYAPAFEAVGFTHFIAVMLKEATGVMSARLMYGRSHAGWREHYIAEGLYTRDPILLQGLSTDEPLEWDQVLKRDTLPAVQRSMMQAPRDHGLGAGMMTPLHHFDGASSAVALLGPPRGPLHPEEHSVAFMLSSFFGSIGARLCETGLIKPETPRLLSDRQREVLQWAALGKTAWETGCILGISTHTVNEYLKAAYAKLKAGNRAQAIALAVHLGEIDPL